ncbi:DUF5615 family PIN-like protein [Candidatus Borrarchaeum sp.]|uniref:DUF5615 family PIN-like protein n=1 Tax=Candidatus Borrarchaeum sp. TaxID=2846742 RepID=UPI0034E0ACA3
MHLLDNSLKERRFPLLLLLKFLLDEDVSHKTLQRLKKQGLIVESVKTLRLLGSKNSELLEYATSKGFIFSLTTEIFCILREKITWVSL